MIVAFARKIRGYSVERQKQICEDAGYKKIYVDGEREETFEDAARAVRKGEALGIVKGRVLGDYQWEINENYRKLAAKGCGIFEIETGQSDAGIIIPNAFSELRGIASSKNRKEMRERGSKGGKKSARLRRKGKMPKYKVEAIWFNKAIKTEDAIAQINNHPDYPEPWSRSALYNLGKRGITPGPRPDNSK